MNGVDLSQLQLAVLSQLLSGDVSGREIREALRGLGWKKSMPAFYQLMARMEDSRLVKGSYVAKTVNNYKVRERRYKLTAPGQRAWNDANSFLGKLNLGVVL